MLRLSEIEDAVEEGAVRTRIVRELIESLAESRKIMLDSNKDLKTRERWTQLHNSTSQILNTVLRDLPMRDWEKRLNEIEEYRHVKPRIRIGENLVCYAAVLEGFIRLVQNSPDSARGLPSQVKGARTQPYQEWLRNAKLRTSSRRGS